ncbi:MAG: hypothetical protein WC073_11480 [Sterolibacterium sp.]
MITDKRVLEVAKEHGFQLLFGKEQDRMCALAHAVYDLALEDAAGKCLANRWAANSEQFAAEIRLMKGQAK